MGPKLTMPTGSGDPGEAAARDQIRAMVTEWAAKVHAMRPAFLAAAVPMLVDVMNIPSDAYPMAPSDVKGIDTMSTIVRHEWPYFLAGLFHVTAGGHLATLTQLEDIGYVYVGHIVYLAMQGPNIGPSTKRVLTCMIERMTHEDVAACVLLSVASLAALGYTADDISRWPH